MLSQSLTDPKGSDEGLDHPPDAEMVRRLALEMPPLRWIDKFIFGLGNIVETVQMSVFFAFGLNYYNQAVGLDAGLTGLGAAIALIVDAVNDPMIGMLSDTWKSYRFGRRHGFLALGVLPCALAMGLFFNAPLSLSQWGLFCWSTIWLIIMRTSASLFTVPHTALGADMAQSYKERTSIMAYNGAIGLAVGPLVAGIGMLVFMQPTPNHKTGNTDPANYRLYMVFCGAVTLVAGYISVFGTAKYIPALVYKQSRHWDAVQRPGLKAMGKKFVGDIMEAFSNRSFASLAVGYLLLMISLGTQESLALIVGNHFWGYTSMELAILPAMYPVAALVAPLVLYVTQFFKIEKRPIAMGAISVFCFSGAFPILLSQMGVVEKGASYVLPMLAAFYFLGCVAIITNNVIVLSMIADVSQDHLHKTDKPREGILYSVRTFCGKAGSAVGHLIAGMGQKAIAFPAKAKMGSVDEALRGRLGWFAIIAVSFWMILSVVSVSRYTLTSARLEEIQVDLAQRQAEADLSDEEMDKVPSSRKGEDGYTPVNSDPEEVDP